MARPVGPDYLATPRRGPGMDHDFYDWRATWAQPRLRPGAVRLGVWFQVAVEWFPLDIAAHPFLPIGAPPRPYPDTQTYTQRDYGNRVGIYRMMDAFRGAGAPASAFVDARLAARYPLLVRHIREAGWEIVTAGLDAGALHHEGLAEDTERGMIAGALALLRAAGVEPAVWHSPSWSQSTRTPALLVQAGMRAMADWPNDEAPYEFRTPSGPILSLPAAYELSDRKILIERSNTLADFEDQMLRAFRRLRREAAEGPGGRLLTVNLSPWIMGQPYRIAALERLLAAFLDGGEDVAVVTVPEIEAAWRAAAGPVVRPGRSAPG